MTVERSPAVHELESFILRRAAEDAEFRRALLADPREAISGELGIELPYAASIEAVETPSGQIALTLPPDLDHAVLAQTQGGPSAADCCICCCC